MSIAWRMGAGEDYAVVFWKWWSATASGWTEAQKLEYLRDWPMPAAWTHIAIEMLWPELGDDLFEIFDETQVELRDFIFSRAARVGLPSLETWEADLNDPSWG